MLEQRNFEELVDILFLVGKEDKKISELLNMQKKKQKKKIRPYMK